MSKVAIIKCKNYDPEMLLEALNRGFSLIGGLHSLVKEGSSVLIKPNLLSARKPDEAVTTHPEFVRAIIKMLKKRNCKISIGDSPSGYGSNLTDRIYEITGMKALCSEENVRLIRFDEAKIIDGIPIARSMLESDLVISAPKLKTHGITVITGAIKNMFGAVVGLTKVEFHKKFPKPKQFSKFIARVFSLAKPGLSIVDAISAMEGEGPSGGLPRNVGLILMGQDAVSVDTVIAHLINVDAKNITSISEAARLKLGESDIRNIEIVGENLKDVVIKDFKLAGNSIFSRLPEPILESIASLIRFRPYIDTEKCTRCNICVKSCPTGMIKEKNSHLKISYDNCINCLCCFEVCTFGAVNIKKSFLIRLISKIKSSENF